MKNFKDYTTQKRSGNEDWIYFIKTNAKNEKMVVQISHCESYGENSLPCVWHKRGWTDKQLNKYLHCQTYVETDKGCFGLYNPQVKPSDDNKRLVINFDWLLEDTEENEQSLIDEVSNRFYAKK